MKTSSARLKLNTLTNACRVLTLASLILFSAGCVTVGPDYKRPEIETPEAFKESIKENSYISPNDAEQKPDPINITPTWWKVYNDPILDSLLQQVEVKNYSLQAALAQVEQARASVEIARAGHFPALAAGGVNDFGLLLSWEIDLWGKIKRNTESSKAAAQASIADLAAAKLSLQTQLAQNYFLLRIKDADIQLSKETSEAYQRSLEISKNQYAAGVVGRENLTQAQAQLSSVQVEVYKAKILRAKLEHSIAVLIGLAPAHFQLEAAVVNLELPNIPLSLPSQLLSRRPDIAAAERRMAAANAQIGVAKARAYPSLSLSSGYRIIKKFVGGSRVALPLYTSGAVSANSKKAAFAYQATVADYRQKVLNSFLEVEDNLVELDLLEQAASAQAEAVKATRKSVEILNNQYRAGIVNYQSIVIVQASSLQNQRNALDILSRRLTSSVALIKALGGGWSSELLQQPEN